MGYINATCGPGRLHALLPKRSSEENRSSVREGFKEEKVLAQATRWRCESVKNSPPYLRRVYSSLNIYLGALYHTPSFHTVFDMLHDPSQVLPSERERSFLYVFHNLYIPKCIHSVDRIINDNLRSQAKI